MRSGKHSQVARYHRMTNELVDVGASFSGMERNHLFVNLAGKSFQELSGVSGIDSPGDARTHVQLDFNRDGFPDVALVNANAPFFQLYRNRVGQRSAHRFFALRLHGGNQTASRSSKWSNRDGVGARIQVYVDDRVLVRELRAGEGFGGQNSKTLLIGLGEHDRADRVGIRWPSGVEQVLEQIPAGVLLHAFENAADSPTEKTYQAVPYDQQRSRPVAQQVKLEQFPLPVDDNAKLTVFVTMATWCGTCKSEFLRLQQTMRALPSESVTAYGLPVDPEDTPKKLEQWQSRHRDSTMPLVGDLTPEQRQQVRVILSQRATSPMTVPNTIVADKSGKVRAVFSGAPTLSQLRSLLDNLDTES